jgi:hypothetical protein
VRCEVQSFLVVTGLQKQSCKLDRRLDAVGETFEDAPQDMLRVSAKPGERELGRNVDHGFETIRAVFDGLQ